MDVNKQIEKGIPVLPAIRTDDDVSDDEPHIRIGKKKASLPPPSIMKPEEE
jgi:hypothetical protein